MLIWPVRPLSGIKQLPEALQGQTGVRRGNRQVVSLLCGPAGVFPGRSGVAGGFSEK